MDRNTIIRIAIPIALYESVKGKVLNEVTAKELNEPWIVWLKDDEAPKKVRWSGPKQKVNTALTNIWSQYGDGYNIQIGAMPEAEWEGENLNEAKKPSAGMTKKEKSAVVKKAKAGKDIGKKGKGFADVEKKAKESGADNPKAVAAAAMWKSQAKKK